jgi:hypothetical protein
MEKDMGMVHIIIMMVMNIMVNGVMMKDMVEVL